MTRPNPHIALIYHYDLASALAGEVVDWQAIPVNVDAGREGGDLCRAAADFAKRRDLFAMPAPTVSDRVDLTNRQPIEGVTTLYEIPAPVIPAAVEQEVADPEPIGLVPVPGSAAEPNHVDDARRIRLRARIIDLVDGGQQIEQLLRRLWPEGVPTLKHVGHTDEQLDLILETVRRVEAEVGAGWHPDDGPPPHVNTDHPTAEVAYPPKAVDEGGLMAQRDQDWLHHDFTQLPDDARALCAQLAAEAHTAGRSISMTQNPTVRRWSIARAVIAWAASGRTVDELWLQVGLLATHAQCCDADATLGGLISQFTIEQADRLYDAAHAAK